MNNFENELATLLNRYSEDSKAQTPDFMLAAMVVKFLRAYGETVRDRELWHGRSGPAVSPQTIISTGSVT